ncbi:MAG: hypothetical protein ACKVZ0_23900 [Gemmatimonadales bacterium]
MYQSARLTLLGLAAGAVWGVLGYLLGAKAFGPAIWPAVLLAPVVGLLVARLTYPGFARTEGIRRALWALASLYLAVILFSLPISVHEVIRRSPANPSFEVALEAPLAVLWGVTLTGFVLFLWPLAYLTHWMIEWRMDDR